MTSVLGKVSVPHSRSLMAILDAAVEEGKPFDLAVATIFGHRSIHISAHEPCLLRR